MKELENENLNEVEELEESIEIVELNEEEEKELTGGKGFDYYIGGNVKQGKSLSIDLLKYAKIPLEIDTEGSTMNYPGFSIWVPKNGEPCAKIIIKCKSKNGPDPFMGTYKFKGKNGKKCVLRVSVMFGMSYTSTVEV